MHRKAMLLVAILSALSLAAAQEPEPVVVKLAKLPIGNVYVSPEAHQILASVDGRRAESGCLKLWNVAQDNSEVLIDADTDNPNIIACTPDWTIGARVTFANNDPRGVGNRFTVSIHLFKPSTLETIRTIGKFQAGIHAFLLNISPNGNYLAYGMSFPGNGDPKRDQPGGIRVFETGTGKELLYISTNIDGVFDLAISPDGKYLAGIIIEGNTRSVRVWEVPTAKLLGTLEGHNGPVMALRFSPDGQWLATVALDGAAILWNPAKGFAKSIVLRKDSGALQALAFNADGSLLAVAGKQGVVTIWNTKTKKPAATFHRPKPKPPAKNDENGILCLSFDKDGKFLTAGAEDGVVRIWPIATATATGPDTKTQDK